ncbi:hypothetical protein U1Q18_036602 [Sarracenia purpurea var. burkii]
MATTAILQSQDFLLRPHGFHSISVLSSPFKPLRCSNTNPNPQSMRSRRRKRSPLVARFPSRNLVMGQVKILKRGEELKPPPLASRKNDPNVDYEDLVVCSTDRLGPEPEMVQKQIRASDLKVVDGLYAGLAASLASPPPSSLPFPSFFANKENHDAATSDLRRLLRLDLI